MTHTSQITVYTTGTSPHCSTVKGILEARGVPYTEVIVTTDADRAEMVSRTGLKHCPVLLIGEEVIGGLEETRRAEQAGRFAGLAA